VLSKQAAGTRLPELSPAKRALLEARQKGLHRSVAMVRRTHEGDTPLSYAQERLYFLHRLQPGNASYHIFSGLRLPGDVDAGALEGALGEVVRRHEALRTTFRESDGIPVQAVSPFDGFVLPVEDLSGIPEEAARAAVVQRRADAEAARPFDLATGPLFRAKLLRLGAQESVLLLCMHHIVSDGWSMPVLYREAMTLYAAFARGQEAALPELPVQYPDFAVWQREQARGGVLERQLQYWKTELAGAPELLELPTDHPRPPAPSGRGAAVPVELAPEPLERLQALARAEGVTLYMVLLAAFQVLLARYSGSEDIVVGTPIAGRTRRETQGLIGFFVNTLVLRTDLGGDPSFRALLGRVREKVLGAFDNQDLPFERLVAELQMERSLSHAPLFQVMFALQDGDGASSAPSEGDLVQVDVVHSTAKFDLTLGLSVTPWGLRGALEYSTDLFEQGTTERMAGHLARLLEQVAADADVPLSRVALMGPAERARVVEEWNRTETDEVSGASIHARIQAQAARTPDAVALVSGGQSLSYAELDARANGLAHRLVRLGVGADVRVGICMERGFEMVVAILAVLKAGGAYVPLDPGYPAERLSYMLTDSGAAVLLTQDGLRDRVPAQPGVVVVAVGDDAGVRADAPATGVAPRNLAYVIYTSGSTGRPKGVAVEHAQVSRYLDWATRTYPTRSSAVHSSLSFDLTVTSLFVPLVSGGAVELMDEDGAVESLAHRLKGDEGYALLKLTPAHLLVLGADLDGRASGGGAECLVVGGEALLGQHLESWKRRFPGTTIVNEYGPTETTVGCCIQVQRLGETGPGQMPIGRPVANTRLYVLDSAGSPAPIGIPGELYIGGAQVTRGYLGRPGLTAERFVPDPFASSPGARLYRTGDRVRWQADGTLEYLGRLDEQVKVRGFRIELGEIEAVLRGLKGVRDGAVVVREDLPGDRRLVAYVAGAADAEAVRAQLRRSLPEYMVPAAIVAVDALPLTPNGKLDRRALPAPEYASGKRYVAPRTPAEEVLAGIWAEVLGQERVGVEESFFSLGGHSLLAMRLASRVRDVFGIELPLRALFEGPTVAEMALRVEEIRRQGLSVLPPVLPADRSAPLPLSFAQERLWFLHRMQPESAFYNVPAVWRIEGGVDEPALERALGEVVRRHEALRTVFPAVDGRPVQVILPFEGLALPIENLSALDADRREAEVRRRVDEEAVRPFDLSAGPLFRPLLLRAGAQDHVLLLCMHHILSDAWSMGVLFRELSALYEAYREGGESPLAQLPVQYADYAVWQREQMQGEALERQLAYWTGRLEGAPALLELPTDHPRPALQTYRGATERIDLPLALLDRLRALGRSEGATLYMVVLGAFQVLLSRYAGTDDVVVGSPISGRTRREVEELIGLFLNTLVLRTELGGDPGFREVLRRVREGTLGAYEHQEVPFERLVEVLQPGRSLSHSPLFQVLFVLQEDAAGAAEDTGGAQLRSVATDSGTSKFDLTLSVAPHAAGLSAVIEYSTDLFERGTILRMLGHLGRVLEQVAADADIRLSALELLGEAERRQVVAGWNATDAEYPSDAPIHALFEAQADRTPDAVSMVTRAGESVTFGELDARANRLANHLAGLGVRPDDRVALCLERGPEMMVAVLGILKAGGAYVPLDPAYPAERLAYMLEDSGARVLLTQESLADRLPPSAAVVVQVDVDAEEIARASAARPRVAVDADHLAYVIYTSGSTGRPKGVAMQHRPLVNLIAWQLGDWRAPANAVTLQFATISFDASFHEMFSAWLAGGSVVLIDEALRYDQAALLELMEREGVERVFMPAVALQQLAEVADARGLVPSRLREVQTAGEQVRVTEPMRRWFTALGAPLYNHYGPSETHVVTSLAMEGDPAEWPLLPGIGAPIANTQCYILDAALRPTPVGIPGELYLGGDNVARGYLGRPALTAERFVPDPFRAGARVYRTGDRARWLADGTIEFLGRTDEQVKIRGFRIEPGEVEAVLAAHDSVREAVVVVREDAPGDRRLVGYVVAAEGASVTSAELRAHLKGRLPEYMVPSAVVVLDAIPLTPSGKVARRALPAPDGAEAGVEYVAPRTAGEELLAGIYADVLRVERVGVESSFFDLGGHSLMAMRLVSRVRDVFGVELPLRAVFETPTVAGMVLRIEEVRRAGLPMLPPIVPVPRTGPPPLSFAQERLWFLDRLQPGSTAYGLPQAFRLTGPLDTAALERALGEIVRRHEALRTTFGEVDGAPVQVVAPFDGFTLPAADLSERSEDYRDEAVRRATHEAARAFDLAAGPLLRVSLLRLANDEHVLLINLHHIVTDAWSMDVLFRELVTLYGAYASGQESPLPELPVQYADHAVWQREQLQGEVLDRQMAYWKERLAGVPELLELPTDRPRPPVQSHRGDVVSVTVPAALVEQLRALARGEGATLYMVLLGAFQVLLSKHSGSEDVVVGSPVAGRTQREVEGLIGLFINTLVLRTDLAGDPGFRGVLRRVRDVTLGAYEHQDVPFEKLVSELQPERSMRHAPLFQVMFNLLNTGEQGAETPSALAFVPMGGGGDNDAKVDVTLTVREQPDGSLDARLGYASDLFESATMARMAAQWTRVLAAVAARPDAPLSAIDVLAEEERSALAEWNRTARDFPAQSVLELFDGWVSRMPDAPALAFEGARLSFAELDGRTRRIAASLAARGVGPEARVGLCVERSAEMIVALLAIMRAGAAYVPLDPAFPPGRMADMMADAGATLVLAQYSLLSTLTGIGAEVVSIGEAERSAPESADLPAIRPESLAYVIYTSGSTGKPKGVAVEHRQLAHYVQAVAERLALPERASYATVSTIAADLGHTSVFGALCGGGCLHVLGEARIADAESFAAYLAENPVDALKITPSHLAALMGGRDAAAVLPRRCLVLGGEASRTAWVDEIRALAPALRIVNHYGPTETTVGALAYVADAELPDTATETVPIGRPLANARAYVLDSALRPQPVGIPGELCIGGRGVARGYLGRAALTAERFVPDPFADEPGARMYRTGDRTRRRADGSVEFQGRLDEQVKIRGFRVEPGEVEAALRRETGVAECAVVAREDAPGERRLVAYVVGQADANALRARLRLALPEYMVPSAFVALDRLPLTPNGKLDRKALPAPSYGSPVELEAPRNYVEVQLIQIWETLLGVAPIGPTQSFFDLGGSSLMALRLFAQVNRRLDCDLPVSTLFAGATIRHMADAVLEQKASDDAPREPVVALRGDGELPPLFVVHATDRDVLGYVNLVRHLGAGQPVFGVRDLAEDLSRPLAQVAAEHVEEIRAVQPDGPYYLAGWSYGGGIAFEMARQLEAQGAEVAFVGLIDTVSPTLASGNRSDAAITLSVAVDAARRARRTLSLTAADLDGRDREAQLRRVADHLQGQGAPLPELEYAALEADAQVLRDRLAAQRGYAPEPFAGTLTLFRAAEGDEAYAQYVEATLPEPEEQRTLGWSRFSTRPVQVRDIPGGHHTMMTEPHVRVLAEHVRASLASASPVPDAPTHGGEAVQCSSSSDGST
jgi:amino acid adenylation domain-containing protein